MSSNNFDHPKMHIQRLSSNPLFTPESSASIGDNINGPSVIAVPDWIIDPLGRYYCYFAHHSGLFIRLAYADQIEGPWTIYEPGTLQLDQCPCLGHIASPDVHIDHQTQRIVMYYHGVAPDSEQRNYSGQRSYMAESADGLHFTSKESILGAFYFRVFYHQSHIYAIAKSITQVGGAVLQRADSEDQVFEFGPEIIRNMRHAAVNYCGNYLEVFYSKGLDAPERIYRSVIHFSDNWLDWRDEHETEIMRPQEDYEGAHLPLEMSAFGAVHHAVNQIRDPAYFKDPHSGKEYLFYSIAGESGIAAGELIRSPR